MYRACSGAGQGGGPCSRAAAAATADFSTALAERPPAAAAAAALRRQSVQQATSTRRHAGGHAGRRVGRAGASAPVTGGAATHHKHNGQHKLQELPCQPHCRVVCPRCQQRQRALDSPAGLQGRSAGRRGTRLAACRCAELTTCAPRRRQELSGIAAATPGGWQAA